jgi:hypothetical protein
VKGKSSEFLVSLEDATHFLIRGTEYNEGRKECVGGGVSITTLTEVSNGRTTDELERIWKEAVVA